MEAGPAASLDVRFGSKADIDPPSADVRFTSKSGHRLTEFGCPLCATFGREQPQQNRSLFDHLVGAGEQRRRHIDTHRLPGFDVDDQLKLCRLLYWQLGRLSAF